MSQPIQVKATPSMMPPSGPTPTEHGDPCTLVIFGATGDLAKRKLFGAIYDMARTKLLAHEFHLVGVDRLPLDDEGFRKIVREAIEGSEEVSGFEEGLWNEFKERITYFQGDLTVSDTYRAIKDRVEAIEGSIAPQNANRLFYLSVPPFLFESIVTNLATSGLAPRSMDAASRPWSRLIIEKPFGNSLSSALALNHLVLSHFGEHQVFRIDHYLGKETVQNILVFRAANAIFEPLWNRQYISHVEITAAETVGVEARGSYYEHAGIVRDMFQNHLLQLLALTAMELPTAMKANLVRDEKVKVLRTIRPFTLGNLQEAVRAQYSEGTCKGQAVQGYRAEPNVSPESQTPTFAAVTFHIDNGRWRDVPFFLRSGKRMAKRTTEIAVFFRIPPYLIDGLTGLTAGDKVEPNVLVLRVQPDDGVSLRFEVKAPGAAYALTPEIEVTPVDMNFSYADAFKQEISPAYETLLLDCMLGDATLFTRSDEVEAGWRITDPLLEYWAQNPAETMPTYAAGSWGPAEADALLEKEGARWRKP